MRALDRHNMEFYLQDVKQAHEKNLSEVFGEAECSPQHPGAVGYSVVCGSKESKTTSGPLINIFLLFN